MEHLAIGRLFNAWDSDTYRCKSNNIFSREEREIYSFSDAEPHLLETRDGLDSIKGSKS